MESERRIAPSWYNLESF